MLYVGLLDTSKNLPNNASRDVLAPTDKGYSSELPLLFGPDDHKAKPKVDFLLEQLHVVNVCIYNLPTLNLDCKCIDIISFSHNHVAIFVAQHACF